jgi:GT2 family glycosyltransferase
MPAKPLLDFSIIIVSWNVRDLLRGCLRSLLASSQVRFAGAPEAAPLVVGTDTQAPYCASALTAEIIVVDNGSTDDSPAMVAAEFPWVALLANAENRGFTGGNNQGLELSRGEYVLFLNPDTVVVEDALVAMVAYMRGHPEVGGVGPQLRYGDGSMQSSRRRFPTLTMALFESTPIAWHWPGNPWARRYHMNDAPMPPAGGAGGQIADTQQTAEYVDWVVGAALIVRRSALDQVGGFDEGFFMYSEEVDWCRRAANAGWRMAYLPAAQVIHYEGKSSEQVVSARQIRFQTSRVRYFRKHHGLAAAEVLRLSLLGMFAFEWALEVAKWVVDSRRPLRRARLLAYGQLLKSGLQPGACQRIRGTD